MDTGLFRSVQKAEKQLIVKKQLTEKELRACILLFPEIKYVIFQTITFYMPLRITGCAYTKISLTQQGNQLLCITEIRGLCAQGYLAQSRQFALFQLAKLLCLSGNTL